jgi:hypothetical protein
MDKAPDLQFPIPLPVDADQRAVELGSWNDPTQLLLIEGTGR